MIYSTQMFAGVAGPTSTTLLTVPSGHVYVLVDVALSPDASGDPDWGQLYVVAPGINTRITTTMVPWQGLDHWRGRAVLKAGQDLRFIAQTRTYRLLVSGYDLINL